MVKAAIVCFFTTLYSPSSILVWYIEGAPERSNTYNPS